MGTATRKSMVRSEGRPGRTVGELIAYAYAAASILIGPLIVFGIGGHISGFDCTDGSWGDLPMADRNAVYADLKVKVLPATIVMVIVGVGVLIGLARSNRGLRSLPAALGVVFMLFWYGVILVFADGLWSCTGSL